MKGTGMNMKKRIFCIILAIVLIAGISTPALAANLKTIAFRNHAEPIALVFADVISERTVTQVVKSGMSIPIYDLTIPLHSTMTEVLDSGVVGRYAIHVEDSSGSFLLFDNSEDTDELDAQIYAALTQREVLLLKEALGTITTEERVMIRLLEDYLTYYIALRDYIKNSSQDALAVVANYSGPENSGTYSLRETTFEFIKAGTYTLWFQPETSTVYSMAIKLTIVDDGTSPTPTPAPAPALVGIPTQSSVFVNGEKVVMEAYNINGSNYFKLRDLAYVLNGSEKQFDVSWDASTSIISITSKQPYTVVGGEMAGKGQSNKTPVPTSAKFQFDGRSFTLTAYNIDGNNYFKLRDVGQTIDFNVLWNESTNAINIITTDSYIGN